MAGYKIVIFDRTGQNRSELDFIRLKLAPGLAVVGVMSTYSHHSRSDG